MSEQENLICQVCGQDHAKNIIKWCDRSNLEIKYQAAQDKIQRLEKKNEIYRKALEFYANDINWNETEPGFLDRIDSDDYGKVNLPIGYVGGKRARQALKDAEEL